MEELRPFQELGRSRLAVARAEGSQGKEGPRKEGPTTYALLHNAPICIPLMEWEKRRQGREFPSADSARRFGQPPLSAKKIERLSFQHLR